MTKKIPLFYDSGPIAHLITIEDNVVLYVEYFNEFNGKGRTLHQFQMIKDYLESGVVYGVAHCPDEGDMIVVEYTVEEISKAGLTDIFEEMQTEILDILV